MEKMLRRMTEQQRRTAAENLHIPRLLAWVIPPPAGLDQDEWRSECYLMLCEAVMRHDPARGSLKTLADRVVKRRWMGLEARRKCKKYGRTRKHQEFFEYRDSPVAVSETTHQDEIEKVVGLVQDLPERPRQAIWGRCHGESFAKIGRKLGTSEAGAFRLVRRTINQLRLAAGEAPAICQAMGAGRAAR